MQDDPESILSKTHVCEVVAWHRQMAAHWAGRYLEYSAMAPRANARHHQRMHEHSAEMLEALLDCWNDASEHPDEMEMIKDTATTT